MSLPLRARSGSGGLAGQRGILPRMLTILIAVLLAALAYALCLALGLPAIVGIVAAILVLIVGVERSGTWPRGRL